MKLTDPQVVEIRRKVRYGWPTRTIADEYGVTPGTIRDIATGRRRGNVPEPSTLQTFPNVEQGTEEWHDLRRGIVTASTVGALITTKTIKPAANETSRGLTALLVAERITGWTEPTFTSNDMLRGIIDEPIARDHYAATREPVTETGFMIREEPNWRLGYSPDGLVGDDGLIEVKSRRPKAHLATVLADEVPLENMAQLQAGLLVSGRKWIDYISWCGGMPMWVRRVYPNPLWSDAITTAVAAFEDTAIALVSAYQAATRGLPPTERLPLFDDEIRM